MKDKLSCYIVEDLLPLYADNLVSEETKRAMGAHLAECEVCKQKLQAIISDQEDPTEIQSNIKKVDFLKKVKARGRKRSTLIGILCVVLTLFAVIMIYSRGFESQIGDLEYKTKVDGKSITVEMKAASETQRIARVVFTTDGKAVNAKVYTTPKLFFKNDKKEYSFTSDSDVKRVTAGEAVLWEKGIDISPKASELYNAKNPYIGDMSANGQIAYILGLGHQFGSYTNKLVTDKTPYGWILKIEEPIKASKKVLSEELMRADSFVLLAVIENMDYVEWEYSTPDGPKSFKFTKEEAKEYCGKDIKEFSKSPSDIQILLDMLGIE